MGSSSTLGWMSRPERASRIRVPRFQLFSVVNKSRRNKAALLKLNVNVMEGIDNRITKFSKASLPLSPVPRE